MTRTHFTITQDGELIFSTPITEQAVNGAKARAVDSGKDVSAVAHYLDAEDREVIFRPDGSNERIWAIDKGQRIEPVVGQVYTNRGGGAYKCVAPSAAGPLFWNGAGGCSNASAVMQNMASGWTFTAKGIIQYIDGTIEWDHSIDGHFEEVTA